MTAHSPQSAKTAQINGTPRMCPNTTSAHKPPQKTAMKATYFNQKSKDY
jgi:hypothetical protein